jgi:hypothetical protein
MMITIASTSIELCLCLFCDVLSIIDWIENELMQFRVVVFANFLFVFYVFVQLMFCQFAMLLCHFSCLFDCHHVSLLIVDMSNSCREPLKALVRCLRETKCMSIDKKSASECSNDLESLEHCKLFHTCYMTCKQNQLNPRSRMRGNKALR